MAPLSIADLVAALPAEDTWGPATSGDNMLNGVPYAPFSKGDKLGRMADWTAESKDRDRAGRQAYNRNYRDQQVYGAGSSSLFSIQAAEEESSFSVVDNTRTSAKRTFGRGGGTVFRGRGQRGGAQRGGRAGFQRVGAGRGQGDRYYDNRSGRSNRGRRFGWKDYDKPQRTREPSVNVRPDWTMLEEVDFSRLSKLNLETPDGEDLDSYGFLYYYDRSYDKAPVKNAERRLQALDRGSPTTSPPPRTPSSIFSRRRTKRPSSPPRDILSMLMCATRSVYSWDIVIVHQGNKIYFDKREGASLDMGTVNENAADAPLELAETSGKQESINTPSALAMEATFINHNFALHTVTESESAKLEMSHPNPFYNASRGDRASRVQAYKYRRFLPVSWSGTRKPSHGRPDGG
ncbi:conserved hypothetical protein [Aspergillus terreus NIH2624]|uniref:Eukaryotic translation initiation factor 3 subunit D n=1 Tax=Aspergillus terreus (strain NIH 2624 / FGSC A1156) TaxID=341663 RepID=Q0CES5_ASPTN|nr:uncharacterized protein ATEG_07809 [Aspergillus terreus NIH2624]EAU32071.1 conserved hypothetical protein [Aspergillus terreus NIH2624]